MAAVSRVERFSGKVTQWAGTSTSLFVAFTIVVLWAISGPFFDFSDTWQLVINTGTTVVTFLMVFLIQRSQNKDAMAIQMKLDELVAAVDGASNRLINLEDMSEEELQKLHSHFQRLALLAKNDEDVRCSHSIEEAEERHATKKQARKSGPQ